MYKYHLSPFHLMAAIGGIAAPLACSFHHMADDVDEFPFCEDGGGGDETASHPTAFQLAEYFLLQDDDDFPPPVVSADPVAPVVSAGSSSSSGNWMYGMNEPRLDDCQRVAFRTKSEIEILDDGFRWRKYGKKSVKNNSSPRNYYRCSTEGCAVKKRVERDREDPSYVITTYDGVHNHPSPSMIYDTMRDGASGQFLVSGFQMRPSS